jgi:hypothetical protein
MSGFMEWLRFGGAKNQKRGPEISGPRRSGRNFKDGHSVQTERHAVKVW